MGSEGDHSQETVCSLCIFISFKCSFPLWLPSWRMIFPIHKCRRNPSGYRTWLCDESWNRWTFAHSIPTCLLFWQASTTMTIELDHFDVHQKQHYVIIATATGLSLSYFHYSAGTGQTVECKDTRSRRLVHGYWWVTAWHFLYAGVSVYGREFVMYHSSLWKIPGLSTGLAQNESDVSGKEMRNFLSYVSFHVVLFLWPS